MDDRQRAIEIGAGLQESRLNTDFIQWLQKWGPRALYALAAVVALYAGSKWYQRLQAEKTDKAFQELSDARGALTGAIYAGSPDALLAVAEKYPDRASVAIQARLDAADIYATSARRGVFPGGDYNAEADRLTPEQKKQQNEKAKALYEQVIASIDGRDRYRPFLIDAHEGLFTTLLSLDMLPEARRSGEIALELSQAAKLNGRSALLLKRLEGIDGLGKLAALPSDADLPESAKIPVRAPASLSMPEGFVGPPNELAPPAPVDATPDDEPAAEAAIDEPSDDGADTAEGDENSATGGASTDDGAEPEGVTFSTELDLPFSTTP